VNKPAASGALSKTLTSPGKLGAIPWLKWSDLIGVALTVTVSGLALFNGLATIDIADLIRSKDFLPRLLSATEYHLTYCAVNHKKQRNENQQKYS